MKVYKIFKADTINSSKLFYQSLIAYLIFVRFQESYNRPGKIAGQTKNNRKTRFKLEGSIVNFRDMIFHFVLAFAFNQPLFNPITNPGCP